MKKLPALFFCVGTFIFFGLNPIGAFSQNPAKSIPDGTEGEFFPKPYDSLNPIFRKKINGKLERI